LFTSRFSSGLILLE